MDFKGRISLKDWAYIDIAYLREMSWLQDLIKDGSQKYNEFLTIHIHLRY